MFIVASVWANRFVGAMLFKDLVYKIGLQAKEEQPIIVLVWHTNTLLQWHNTQLHDTRPHWRNTQLHNTRLHWRNTLAISLGNTGIIQNIIQGSLFSWARATPYLGVTRGGARGAQRCTISSLPQPSALRMILSSSLHCQLSPYESLLLQPSSHGCQ